MLDGITELTGALQRHPGGHNFPDMEVVVDPSLTERQRADALNIAQSAGSLKRYLQIDRLIIGQAQDRADQCQREIEEMRAEGAE